jgi:hypothetical protein
MVKNIWIDLIDKHKLLVGKRIIPPDNKEFYIYFKNDSSIEVTVGKHVEIYGDFIVVVEIKDSVKFTSFYACDDLCGIMFTKKL